jgi:PPK2 family polyphosphate:nucleotide phosphotransferase
MSVRLFREGPLFQAAAHPHLAPFDGGFRLADRPTGPGEGKRSKKSLKRELAEVVDQIGELQERLYAEDEVAVLLVFQAMDAAGKDGTIRAVMTGINPAGCQVFSFKQPSKLELDHDFLWRTTRCLPERGRIGIFNRSYYEETLVVRVHPELLEHQRLPWPEPVPEIFERRLAAIAAFEEHLARSGTVVLKFFLNVSHAEQKERFLARIDERAKNWKFSSSDVRERQFWPAYMSAYEQAIAATSRPWAPWYVVPADHKPTMRLHVAQIVRDALQQVDPQFPVLDDHEAERLEQMRAQLMAEAPLP